MPTWQNDIWKSQLVYHGHRLCQCDGEVPPQLDEVTVECLEGEVESTARLLTPLTGCTLDHVEVKGRKVTLVVSGTVLVRDRVGEREREIERGISLIIEIIFDISLTTNREAC